MPDFDFDRIDREAKSIKLDLENGNRQNAVQRLHDDLYSMGQTQAMAMIGEAKALSDNCPTSLSHIELVPINCNGNRSGVPDKVDIQVVTPVIDREGRQVVDQTGRPMVYRDDVAVLDNNRPLEQRPVVWAPEPPPVVIAQPPVIVGPSCPPPIERIPPIPCPPTGPQFRIDLDLIFGRGHRDDDRHREPDRGRGGFGGYGGGYGHPDYDRGRPNAGYDRNTGAGNVIINNNNNITVRSDSTSSSNSSARNAPHTETNNKRTDDRHHK